jgi:hypothetical protein
MSLREYHRTLMKEAAASSSSTRTNSGISGGGGSPSSSSPPLSNHGGAGGVGGGGGDVMNMRVEHVLVWRLEEKWEKVVAHVTMVVLEQSRQLVASLQLVLYATSACLVLYGTAQLVKAIRRGKGAASASSSSSAPSKSSNIMASRG